MRQAQTAGEKTAEKKAGELGITLARAGERDALRLSKS